MLPRRSWPTRWNEFLPISIPITAISLSSFWDMACSFVFGVPASLLSWAGLERRSWPDETERVLAEIDPDYGNFAINFRGHGVLLCLRCPGQLASAGRGLEHGRTIPLADLNPAAEGAKIPRCNRLFANG